MRLALRGLARLVFLAALLTWGRLAFGATGRPETWAATRQRTAAFLVMVGAGLTSIALAPKQATTPEEESY